mgnify:CR=1 FL=1
MNLTIRPIGDKDVDAVQLALYAAVTWDRDDAPPREVAVHHPELLKYWQGWGRPGDFGAFADVDGVCVGAAYARTYSETDGSYGFVAADIPEISIGVLASHRGKGVGRMLLARLETTARRAGFTRLSLSVNHENPARALYVDVGYEEIDSDESSVRMIKHLP